MSDSKRAQEEFRAPTPAALMRSAAAASAAIDTLQVEDSGPRPVLQMSRALELMEVDAPPGDPYNAVGRRALRSRGQAPHRDAADP